MVSKNHGRRDHSVGRTWSGQLSWSARMFFFPGMYLAKSVTWATRGHTFCTSKAVEPSDSTSRSRDATTPSLSDRKQPSVIPCTSPKVPFPSILNEWKKIEKESGYVIYALLPKKNERYRRRGIKVEPKWLGIASRWLSRLRARSLPGETRVRFPLIPPRGQRVVFLVTELQFSVWFGFHIKL